MWAGTCGRGNCNVHRAAAGWGGGVPITRMRPAGEGGGAGPGSPAWGLGSPFGLEEHTEGTQVTWGGPEAPPQSLGPGSGQDQLVPRTEPEPQGRGESGRTQGF